MSVLLNSDIYIDMYVYVYFHTNEVKVKLNRDICLANRDICISIIDIHIFNRDICI